jgi:hypothetical protein
MVTKVLMCAYVHCLLGVGFSMVSGFLPEGILSHYYYDTRLEAFAPAIAFTGLILGFFFSVRFQNGRGASLAWIFGLLWLAGGFYDAAIGWKPMWSTQKSSWDYAMVELFGRTSACSSECLRQVFFTIPFTASVTYSIGSIIRKFSSWPTKSAANSFHEKAGRCQGTLCFFLSVSLFPFS